jgi:hypothetical protein
MGCHWHSVLITGQDDGITLVGVRVSELGSRASGA